MLIWSSIFAPVTQGTPSPDLLIWKSAEFMISPHGTVHIYTLEKLLEGLASNQPETGAK